MRKRPAVLATLGTLVATVSAIGVPPAQAAPIPIPITAAVPTHADPTGAGDAPAAPTSSEVALEVKFQEALQVRGSGQALRSAQGNTLEPVQTVLARHHARSVTPLLQGVSEATLDRLSATAKARSGKAVPDMASWYGVVPPAGTDVDQLVDELRALPEVAYAYPAPDPVPPPASPTPDFTGQQGYQRPAPQGIDADFSRRDKRTRGAGIQIADLEYDWNIAHEDLQLDASSDLGGTVFPRYTAFADEHVRTERDQMVRPERARLRGDPGRRRQRHHS